MFLGSVKKQFEIDTVCERSPTAVRKFGIVSAVRLNFMMLKFKLFDKDFLCSLVVVL